MERVAKALGRTLEDGTGGPDVLTAYGVCRTKTLGSVQALQKGIREIEEEIVVLIPLDTWDNRNGLFVDTKLDPGQDICVGGSEQITWPGTGGCRLILLCLKIPPTVSA